MLRISKLTDYGTMVLACLAARPERTAHRDHRGRADPARPADGQQAAEEPAAGRARDLVAWRARRLPAGAPGRAASVPPRSSTRSRARWRSPSAAAITAPATSRPSAAPAPPGSASTAPSAARSTQLSLAQLSGQEAVAGVAPRTGGRDPRRSPVERPGRTLRKPACPPRSRTSTPSSPRSTGTASSPTSSPTPCRPGLDEDVIRLISRKKGEPQFMLDWRLKAFRHWLTMQEPDWAHLEHRADRLPGDLLLLGAEEEGRAEEPRRGRPEAARHLREARHPAARARARSPASRSTRCSTASRWRPPSRTSSPRPA